MHSSILGQIEVLQILWKSNILWGWTKLEKVEAERNVGIIISSYVKETKQGFEGTQSDTGVN